MSITNQRTACVHCADMHRNKMVDCRRVIHESLPHPQGEKDSEVFTISSITLARKGLDIKFHTFSSVYYVDDVARGTKVNSRFAMHH